MVSPWILLGLALVVMPGMAAEITLADFSSEGAGASWRIVNDTVMGGRSSSRFQISDGALHFTGTLNTNGGGFASVRGAPLRVAEDSYDRIRLRVTGDGRRYQLRLTAASTGTGYRALFDTEPGAWRVVEIPLDEFQATWRGRLLDRPPIRASDIAELGILLADGKDGAFLVSVSAISLRGS